MGLRFDVESRNRSNPPVDGDPVIRVTATSHSVTLLPQAHLGVEVGGLLCELVEAAASTASAVEIDVGRVTSFTPAGAAELLNCRAVGAALPGGVRYRASTHLGQRVLLAAFRAHG
jgi:hypothetical protein